MFAVGLLMAAAVAGGPSATVYRIDPARAEAGFELKATMHTVHGRTSKVGGEVRVVDRPDGSKGLDGTIEVDAASLETANASRDRTMHEKSLAVDRFPVLRFAPDRFEPSGPAASGGPVAGKLSGTLTIREISKPVTMEATLTPIDAGGFRVEGRFDVSWSEFGIPDPSFLFVRIDKVVHARFAADFRTSGP